MSVSVKHTCCFRTDTLENSHPVHHMQIATHPEEPLHFLRTSRPTMLHLCGHFSTSEKAQRSAILLRSILGWRWRSGHKWRPLFSAYTLLQIHNLFWLSRSQESHRCVFSADIKRSLCETLDVLRETLSGKKKNGNYWLFFCEVDRKQRPFKKNPQPCEDSRMCWPHFVHPHPRSNHRAPASLLANPAKLSQSLVAWELEVGQKFIKVTLVPTRSGP